jgi:hypothetical protein
MHLSSFCHQASALWPEQKHLLQPLTFFLSLVLETISSANGSNLGRLSRTIEPAHLRHTTLSFQNFTNISSSEWSGCIDTSLAVSALEIDACTANFKRLGGSGQVPCVFCLSLSLSLSLSCVSFFQPRHSTVWLDNIIVHISIGSWARFKEARAGIFDLLPHALPAITGSVWIRTQIGMFRPIRMDHTNCLQVAIKTHQTIIQRNRNVYNECKHPNDLTQEFCEDPYFGGMAKCCFDIALSTCSKCYQPDKSCGAGSLLKALLRLSWGSFKALLRLF